MHCHVVGLRAYLSTEGKRGHALAVNVTSRAALVMNSLNPQKPTELPPSSRCVNTEQRAEHRNAHLKVFHGWQMVFGEKRSQAFESPRSARSDSL